MSKTETLTVEGLSGTKYKFNIYPIGTNFKDVGGVYTYTKENNDDTHTLLYVGRTESFQDRLGPDHHKYYCVIRNGGTHICTHRNDDEDVQKRIERDILQKHSTPCNDK